MKTTAILMIALVAAIGAAAITTALSFVEQADAKSCKDERRPCHGCSHKSQGEESSEGKCSHEEGRR